ncbi:ANL, N-terminal domain [Fusarium oxysporum f. sp. vasinfectum]|nr:ANL, N-terminal domain [Fusarium oxysporum f. sp. vasinfectum]
MALQTQKDYDALYKRLTTVPPPGKPYGIPVPGTERPNRTAAYRHWAVGDGPLVTALEPGINSTHDVLERSARKWPNSRCLGTRHWNQATQQWEDKYDWISYGDFDARRKNFGAGLVEIHKAINYSPEKYGVGLWSQNRAEWQIADFGIASQSLYSVSLYETLGPDTTEYIINHAEVACVVCSLPHIPVLLKMSPRLPGLKLIVSLDPLEQGELASHTKASVLNEIASHHGIQIYSMTQVEEIGAKSGRAPRAPSRNDICTINYTSGTTGNPKGVLITHGNAVSAIAGGRTNGNVSSKDVHLSYLPLAHIYGRLIDQIAVAEGAAIGFFRGDILGLVDDMKILKPTGFISVPRLFNRFNSAIRTATIEADGVRGALSRRVIDTKKANMRLPPGKASNTHFLYDRIWTPKVKAAVGMDRVHSMVSGSAQLDPDVQEFLRAAFANHFAQGFGMTETYAVGSIQARGDFTTGNIGGPMCCVELCLESVPEFDYTVDKMGRFKIIDRKKNVLKLAQGEYISPERIENVYMGSTNLINAAYVHGDGTQSSLVAIFGIDVENFAPFASKILQETIAPNQVADLRLAANDPKVKAKFLKVLDGIGKKHKFNSFEKVRNAHLEIDPFTIDNGLFTPTLKLKRPQAAKAYREHIDRMYEELAAQEPVGKNKL